MSPVSSQSESEELAGKLREIAEAQRECLAVLEAFGFELRNLRYRVEAIESYLREA